MMRMKKKIIGKWWETDLTEEDHETAYQERFGFWKHKLTDLIGKFFKDHVVQDLIDQRSELDVQRYHEQLQAKRKAEHKRTREQHQRKHAALKTVEDDSEEEEGEERPRPNNTSQTSLASVSLASSSSSRSPATSSSSTTSSTPSSSLLQQQENATSLPDSTNYEIPVPRCLDDVARYRSGQAALVRLSKRFVCCCAMHCTFFFFLSLRLLSFFFLFFLFCGLS